MQIKPSWRLGQFHQLVCRILLSFGFLGLQALPAFDQRVNLFPYDWFASYSTLDEDNIMEISAIPQGKPHNSLLRLNVTKPAIFCWKAMIFWQIEESLSGGDRIEIVCDARVIGGNGTGEILIKFSEEDSSHREYNSKKIKLTSRTVSNKYSFLFPSETISNGTATLSFQCGFRAQNIEISKFTATLSRKLSK